MTSRLTVEAARFIRLAISRIDESEAIPREISSRSARVRARGDRRRAAGRIPPRGNKTDRMQLCSLPKARPISCSDCPAFQRVQTSPFSIAESPNLFPGLMPTPPFPKTDLHQMVLHRPIEFAALPGQVEYWASICPGIRLIEHKFFWAAGQLVCDFEQQFYFIAS